MSLETIFNSASARIEAEILAGRMTKEQGETLLRGALAEAQTANFAALAASAPAPAATGPDVGSDYELAVSSLSREFPQTKLVEIQHEVGINIKLFSERIEAERALKTEQLKTKAEAAQAASPEGRLAAAHEASDARLKKADRARLSRILLAEEGQVTEQEVASLSDDEALRFAGLVQTDDGFLEGASDWSKNVEAAKRGSDRNEGGESS